MSKSKTLPSPSALTTSPSYNYLSSQYLSSFFHISLISDFIIRLSYVKIMSVNYCFSIFLSSIIIPSKSHSVDPLPSSDLVQKSTLFPSRTIYQTVPPRLSCGSFVPCLAASRSPYLTCLVCYIYFSPTDSDFDYPARRMSSSTVSAETDSSVASRPEKRPLSPSSSPQPLRPRPSFSSDQPSWHFDSAHHSPQQDDKPLDTALDNSKVQLPSIFTTFEDPFRRASLPALSQESSSRYRSAPYPPTHLRRASHASSNLGSYHFPPPSDTSEFQDKSSSRPRLTADTHLNYSYGDSPSYLNTSLSTTTTPSSHFSSSAFTSPLTPDIKPQGVPTSGYIESDSWNDSPSGIVRPSSAGQLPSTLNKYDDSVRHSSFSTTSQMFSAPPRLPPQQDRRLYPSSAQPKDDWNFANQDYAFASNSPSLNTTNSPVPSATPAPATTSSPTSRSPPSAPSSALAERPMRKRGKLPKETTDYLKAWLHRHSDHPYPSEEEKKQLCNATGLSMSQVSNWMINVRIFYSPFLYLSN